MIRAAYDEGDVEQLNMNKEKQPRPAYGYAKLHEGYCLQPGETPKREAKASRSRKAKFCNAKKKLEAAQHAAMTKDADGDDDGREDRRVKEQAKALPALPAKGCDAKGLKRSSKEEGACGAKRQKRSSKEEGVRGNKAHEWPLGSSSPSPPSAHREKAH
ncbi:hypothetical protein CYMTET_24876 [Cymbomonas tetramitiformis]|uniref:Uncharacterized protein n=1 Tax=Cymbomonas tetramitiformis TaxID=36881 RepID=A0AAE0FUY7_9CHLO|nr:hypothetical protein CYMTET_24876 [Cymbomonas tetramitiformis]